MLVSEAGVPKLTDFGNSTLRTYSLKFTGEKDTSKFSLRWTVRNVMYTKSENTNLSEVAGGIGWTGV